MGRPKGSKNKPKEGQVKRGRGRPKGSTNGTKSKVHALDLNRKAEYFAAMFIGYEHIDGAERLAERVLQKILASKASLARKPL